ncbi:lipid II flippase MurJ [Chromobacterium violaceum]|uniref:lipid II flippase MurJ n=1 Tax=Chromobacterium violaceum TaxID=536 RepID=UPI001B33FDF4|nr:lipid II flippase MurJ [Chromobacterium violaceum]MBP4046232.1 hypothetical protein [Chromobacterium violaceum]
MSLINWSSKKFKGLSKENQQIAKSALMVAFFVLLAKSVAALKEVAVAWKYGVSDVVDAYQMASTIMLWLPAAISSALMTVLIPILFSLENKKEEKNQFLSELQGGLLLIGAVSGAVLLFIFPNVLSLVSKQLNPSTAEIVRQFSIGYWLPAVLSLLITLHSTRLMMLHRQWNTLLEGMPALFILLFILIWPKKDLVAPLILGTIVGFFFQNFILTRLANKHTKEKIKYRFSFKSPHWITARNYLGLMVLAQFCMSWVGPIDMISAVRLGQGAIAQLGYSERILSLFLGLGAMAISRAILPVFSEMADQGDNKNRLLDASIKWGVIMFALGTIAAFVAWNCADFIIKILYQRGAFHASDTQAVAAVFQLGVLRLPFYFAGLVFFQLLASMRLFFAVVLINFSCVLIKYPLNLFLVGYFGTPGINFSTAMMYAWTMLSMLAVGYFVVKRKSS